MKPLINDFSKQELTERITDLGEPAYRAQQVWQMIYKQLIASPDDFSNLSKELRQKLDETYCFEPLDVLKDLKSSDGQTNKLLFGLHLDTGRLSDELCFLRDRPDGVHPQPFRRGDRGPDPVFRPDAEE